MTDETCSAPSRPICARCHIEMHRDETIRYCGFYVTHDPDRCVQLLNLRLAAAEAEATRLKGLLNTPETDDFDKAVPLEAAHQQERWAADHDAGKEPSDWFWLLGYLAGKALAATTLGNTEKALHHCVSSAAALRNWHAHIRNGHSRMRPGIETPKEVTHQVELEIPACPHCKGTGWNPIQWLLKVGCPACLGSGRMTDEERAIFESIRGETKYWHDWTKKLYRMRHPTAPTAAMKVSE